MKSISWVLGTFLLVLATAASADGVDLFNPSDPNNPNSFGEWWSAVSIFPSARTIDPKYTSANRDIWTSADDFSCYDADTKLPLDCQFTLTLVGVEDQSDKAIDYHTLDDTDIYGGHSHNKGQAPVYDQFDDGPGKDPIITVIGSGSYKISPDGKSVTGQTNFSDMEVDIDMPENAGAIWITSTIKAPKNYVCGGGCFDNVTSKWHETWIVGYAGLTQLFPNTDKDPASGYVYYVSRKPAGDPGHTNDDAMWGVPSTVLEVQTIAQKYFELNPLNATLGYNDMSLPHGGLFDISDDWNLTSTDPKTWAHQDHRYGRAMDVTNIDSQNQQIPCSTSNTPDPNKTNWFAMALDEQDAGPTPGAPPPAPTPPGVSQADEQGYPVKLVCESAGRIHIQINSPDPLSLIQLQGIFP